MRRHDGVSASRALLDAVISPQALICAKFPLAPQRYKARNAGRDRTRSRACQPKHRSAFPARLPAAQNPPAPLAALTVHRVLPTNHTATATAGAAARAATSASKPLLQGINHGTRAEAHPPRCHGKVPHRLLTGAAFVPILRHRRLHRRCHPGRLRRRRRPGRLRRRLHTNGRDRHRPRRRPQRRDALAPREIVHRPRDDPAQRHRLAH